MSENQTQEQTSQVQDAQVVQTQPQQTYVPLPEKSKVAAGVLYLLLGDIGVGNFYMGKVGLGIVDILFCWTGIPGIVGFIRGLIILCGSKESFERKYRVKASD